MWVFFLGLFVLGSQISGIEASSCAPTITARNNVPVRNTLWQEALTFQQFDPAQGVLDAVVINITWVGNATYQYGFFEDDEERAIIESQFTPQLTSTVLALAYPIERIGMGDYNLLSSSFNRDFEPVPVWNRAFPENCPNGDPALCDVNAKYDFQGQQISTVTTRSVLNSFTGTGTFAMGSFATGSATGRLEPSPGGPIIGTLALGITVELTFIASRLTLEKRVENQRAFDPPGPTIQVSTGAPVHFTYNITNYGSGPISNLAVTDDQGVSVTCPSTTVDACGWVVCTGQSGTVTPGLYRNNATCTAQGSNTQTCNTDRAHYFGALPLINVTKYTNNFHPNAGVLIRDQPVTWRYIVSNPGNVELSAITLTDTPAGAVTCPATTLLPAASMTCQKLGTAIAGPYSNSILASGLSGVTQVTATDANTYFGATPSISVVKLTNGVLVGGSTAQPLVLTGNPVTWTYVVSNTGGVTLTAVAVHDNQFVPVAVCPTATLVSGAVITCAFTGSAVSGQYNNVGTASGVSGLAASSGVPAATVTATAPSSYFGVLQRLSLTKITNGVDISTNGGVVPFVLQNDPVTWSYVVTNTGNVALSGVNVNDNRAGATVCTAAETVSLAAAATLTCFLTGVATQNGAYANVGTASATSPLGATITATSPSGYFGVVQQISVVKTTNGQVNLTWILQNDPVTWRYVVTNRGNSILSNIDVHDDHIAVAATCPSPATLAATSSFTCSITGIATSRGPYANVGTATGISPAAAVTSVARATVTATAPSTYFGVDQHISVNKFTNGHDLRSETAPLILQGSPVTWTFEVTNTGNAFLSTITVLDVPAGAAVCPIPAALAAGATFTCTASGVAVSGSYTNVATARGVGPTNTAVVASATSGYTGVVPGIQLVKFTNGIDIRSASAPHLLRNTPVTWTYRVTNSGTSTMSSISVTDNLVASVTCPDTTLTATASFTCTAVGAATATGSYANIGSVRGVVNGAPISATSTSGYFGVIQSVSVVKFTNGVDIRSASPPNLLLGRPVTWRFAVTNTGNSALSNVAVTDDRLTPASVAITCPSGTLAAGASFDCAASGTVVEGTYANTGTATGVSTASTFHGVPLATVTATSNSGYFGVRQAISVVKRTNGVLTNGDTSVQPRVFTASPVTWTYEVTNTGNSVLSSVSVIDNQFPSSPAVCPSAILAATSSMICSATGTARTGQYNNVGTASGISPAAQTLPVAQATPTSTSPSSYIGFLPTISIVKTTNGINTAATGTRPNLSVGSPVTWQYTVTNTAIGRLTNVTVTDNRFTGAAFCPSSVLEAGETMTCAATGVASAMVYDNVGTARGFTAHGVIATSTHTSGYSGVNASIAIVKFTNDVNTNTAARPNILVGASSRVTWKYVVSNAGNSALSAIAVTDDQGVTPVCPTLAGGILAIGASFTCTATATAIVGEYVNVGQVTGVSALGLPVSASSPSRYFGANPSVSLQKLTNDVRVTDSADAVVVDAGSIVTWKYVVSNSGNFALTSVVVVDDKVASSAIRCPTITSVAPGDTVVCSATALVPSSTVVYTNIATVTARSLGSVVVSSSDRSWYNPVVSNALRLIKRANGVYTGTDPPPRVRVGCPVTWTYEVTNTGTADLSNIVVTDEFEEPVITCPNNGPLAPSATLTCAAIAAAVDCAYSSVGTATGSRGTRDSSASAYIGIMPIISLQKFTNLFDHNALRTNNTKYPPFKGPCVLTGSRVTWTYVVSNIGDDLLSNVRVDDDRLGPDPVCTLGDLAPWYSRTCVAVGFVEPGQYHNQASAVGSPATGSCDGNVVSVDEEWFVGVLPDVKVTLEVNGFNYYDPLCDICRKDGSSSGEGEGEGSSEGEGHSVHGDAFPGTATTPEKQTLKAKAAPTPTHVKPTADATATGRKKRLFGDGFGIGPDGRSIHTIIGPDGRSIHDDEDNHFNGGKKVRDPDGKSIHSFIGPDGKKVHYGKQYEASEGEGESDSSEGPCVDFEPRNKVTGEGTGSKQKGKAADAVEDRRKRTVLGADAVAPLEGAHQDALSGKSGEGEGESHSVHVHTPLAPPRHCNAALLPQFVIGSQATFRFTVENTGTEILEHVYLQLGELCDEAQDYSSSSSSSEGEGESYKGNALGEKPQAAEKDATGDAHQDVLSSKGKDGNSGKSGKKHVRKTHPADGLGDKFGTQYIVCPTSTLGIGERMVCNVSRIVLQSYGVQQLTVRVRGVGKCTSQCVNSWSAAQWYTPAPPPPPPVSSSSTGVKQPDEGKGESKRYTGCNVYFWKSTRANNRYPTTLAWTPDTSFATAAGLDTSADPTAGLTLSQVMWSRGYDLESKFFRGAAVALLNAATVPGFGLTVAQVQAEFSATWTEYKARHKASLLQKAISGWDSRASKCPFY